MNPVALAKQLTRNGYCYNLDPEFTLRDFDAVQELMLLPIKLIHNYFDDGQWVLLCPEIIESQHNAFWHGQGVDVNDPIANPTKWIVNWQQTRRIEHES